MGNAIQILADGAILCAQANTWVEGDAITQLKSTLKLAGMRRVAGLPDLHPGRGYPIGAAFFSVWHVYPTLVGSDIGCGMAFWQTDLSVRRASVSKLVRQLGNIDAPVDEDWDAYITNKGFKQHPHKTTLGTIGNGNHFAELQRIDTVYDEDALLSLGVQSAYLQLLVHSGSRGLGQAILSGHVEKMGHASLTTDSQACLDYLTQHDAALQFAQANRELIAMRMLARWHTKGARILDAHHNFVCSMTIQGEQGWLHRKGATSVSTQPVVIPGSRGDYSYLVQPVLEVGDICLYSLAHGAGRKWGRADCKGRLARRYTAEQLMRTGFGSHVVCENTELLFEEAPQAYKSIDSVVEAMQAAGLLRKLARLSPVLTYKTKGGWR